MGANRRNALVRVRATHSAVAPLERSIHSERVRRRRASTMPPTRLRRHAERQRGIAVGPRTAPVAFRAFRQDGMGGSPGLQEVGPAVLRCGEFFPVGGGV